MLSESEKKQIRTIVQSPQWKSFEHLIDILCSNIRKDSVVRPTEWETLQTALINEGQVQGLKRLIQEIFLTLQDE